MTGDLRLDYTSHVNWDIQGMQIKSVCEYSFFINIHAFVVKNDESVGFNQIMSIVLVLQDHYDLARNSRNEA